MTFDTAERCGYNTIHHGNSHQKIQYCIAGRFPFAKAVTYRHAVCIWPGIQKCEECLLASPNPRVTSSQKKGSI